MTPIVPPSLDIEHWSAAQDTGTVTMFKAMQAEANSAHWVERQKSIGELVRWWAITSTYDPDWEPENLIVRSDLTPLSKEILGIAAVHRTRPGGLRWEVPDAKETREWLASSQAKTIRHALEINNSGDWWNRCLFEGSISRYHARTEHLVSALMADHPFVHMANSLNVPLHELLPMMADTPKSSAPASDVLALLDPDFFLREPRP